ncbi:MAG: electron transport complex subunit RsxE [Lentisphaerae bacterium]|nr:MAG: electron transport complex subunit RsxE [Lentisphaerota bacterium]
MSDNTEQLSGSEYIIRGILPENPVYRQLLGMCPTLAITVGVKEAITMAGATAFVLICANLMTSLIRNLLKPHLRILVFTLTIAAFVTIADRFLAAFLPEMSDKLGPYVPLIIVNCLIISRCEACSSKSGLWVSLLDGIGMSLGFAIGLVSIATVREILAKGEWFGLRVLPQAWPNWSIMVFAPGAFFTLGMLLALVQFISSRRLSKKEHC